MWIVAEPQRKPSRYRVYSEKDVQRFEVNAGVAREVFTHRLVGIARLGWLHRNQDTFEGTPVLVGGGNWMYVTPGATVRILRGINLQADVKIPVYRRLANTQLDSRAVLQLGVSREF